MSKLLERITNKLSEKIISRPLKEGPYHQIKGQILQEMQKVERKYLKPHDFKKYGNYWLPKSIVKNSKNILSFGVHTDVRWEQSICKNNPGLNIHCYDPTPCCIDFFKTDFPCKENITYHPIAYAKENGKMKFYYRVMEHCFSLIPLNTFGENPSFIEVETKNLVTIMQEDMPQVDIIKADIEGVWYDICREILDNNIDFKAFLIEFELYTFENVRQYKELLKEFKGRGYKLYLNRSRDKTLSEVIILK